MPLLSSKTNITSEQLDDITAMCNSLYRSKSSSSSFSGINLENATFYEHLVTLKRVDGLRLATAQMVISSSVANGHLAGGDILRMGQNILKFENLRMFLSSSSSSSSSTTSLMPLEMLTKKKDNFQLLSLSMDDYIANVRNTTLTFLDFVLGGGGSRDGSDGGGGDDGVQSDDILSARLIVPRVLRIKAAEDMAFRSARSKKGQHVTQGKHDDREELIQALREDVALGPVLSEIELLVENALR